MEKNFNWPGGDRRYPSHFHPCKYTLDRIREAVIEFASHIKKDSVVLDFGCGEKPYYPFFKDVVREYIGIDIDNSPEKNENMNLTIKQGEALPFQDEYFDAIVSTQVFEHIEDLYFYAKELRRVLKPGGIVFISAAYAWDFHPYPNDYWRITEDGYNSLFKEFSEIKFSRDTNSLQTIIQSFNLVMARKGIKCQSCYKILNYIISKINYKNGDIKFPANLFVNLKK
jgi:SAM-dependent methyltransferase